MSGAFRHASMARVRDTEGRTHKDGARPAGPEWSSPSRRADGRGADRVGAWPEKGIISTQLGPNRNGRAW